jgi:hypothetical protein
MLPNHIFHVVFLRGMGFQTATFPPGHQSMQPDVHLVITSTLVQEIDFRPLKAERGNQGEEPK